jgi:hypothetical protein
MRPRERRDSGQNDLFRARLDQIVDMDHALAKLRRTIDWRFLEDRFGAYTRRTLTARTETLQLRARSSVRFATARLRSVRPR